MKLLDISEIAKRSGMPASTLRFYEERPDRITRPARAQAHFRPRRAWTAVVDCARTDGGVLARRDRRDVRPRSDEHTSELPSLMRISYAVFFLNKNNTKQ